MSQISSYKDVEKFFSTARNKDKGKPLQGWGNITKEGEKYVVSVYNRPLYEYRPDNTIEFLLSGKDSRSIAITLAQVCRRHLPFIWLRKGVGQYLIIPDGHVNYNQGWEVAGEQFKNAPKYDLFKGLQLDLTGNYAINPKYPDDVVVDTDRRKVWLRTLKKYKQSAKVKAKLGVLDTIITAVNEERKTVKQMPDWESDEWQNKLYESILSETVTTDMLKAFVQSTARWSWHNAPRMTPKEVLDTISKTCGQYSKELRVRFGVLQGE